MVDIAHDMPASHGLSRPQDFHGAYDVKRWDVDSPRFCPPGRIGGCNTHAGPKEFFVDDVARKAEAGFPTSWDCFYKEGGSSALAKV